MVKNCLENAKNMVDCEENLDILKKKLHFHPKTTQTVPLMLKSLSLIIEHSLKAKRAAEISLNKKIGQEISEYEKLLQKLEAEVRNHIRVNPNQI